MPFLGCFEPALTCLFTTPKYGGVELLTQTFLADTHLCGETRKHHTSPTLVCDRHDTSRSLFRGGARSRPTTLYEGLPSRLLTRPSRPD